MKEKWEIDRQILNLGFEDVMTQEEGRTMVEAAVRAVPFQSARLQPRIEKLESDAFVRRLWERDGGLWKEEPSVREQIRNSLGWLDVADKMEEKLAELTGFVKEVTSSGFSHAVHMGMGGSSLAPLSFQRLFQPVGGGLSLSVLDTTDPRTIARMERELPLSGTIFIVASKSGTTAEPLAFDTYFFEKMKAVKGDRAGENFIAITDPGTHLERTARERGFRRIFLNFPDIGGRYSALSYFGLVPAALMGLDIKELLDRAIRMERACGPAVPEPENPGVALGAVIGEMVRLGRDKLTLLLPPGLSTLGMWLEQLIAESTGKEGTGVLPIAGEDIGDPPVYGNDRLFVYIFIKGQPDEGIERGVRLLQAANLPVVFIELRSEYDIAQEFYRWEIATAVAGAVLGINPFDQPNVQESKDATNRMLKEVEERGTLAEARPVLREGPLSFYYREEAGSAEELLWSFLSQGHGGDYISLQAYLSEGEVIERLLRDMRLRLRNELRLATTVGYGPRLLHSTGQFHKGGPNTGLFIQFTRGYDEDLPIPGRPYGFGVLIKAQAMGDYEALTKHGRRVMRVDLGPDEEKGLAHFQSVLQEALTLPRRR